MIRGRLSIGIKLDDIIKDENNERIILENIRGASKIVGARFQAIFWHVKLTEQECKDFVKRNEHLLFEISTKITKSIKDVWFLVGDGKEGRYRYDGDILKGIVQYLEIISHMKKRDGE